MVFTKKANMGTHHHKTNYQKRKLSALDHLRDAHRLTSASSSLGNITTCSLLLLSALFILFSSSLLVTNDILFCSSALFSHASSRDTYEESDGADVLVQQSRLHHFDTNLNHIFFGIAALADRWDSRKDYIKQWWRPRVTRGVVWLDKPVKTRGKEVLPEIRISGDTSGLRYTNAKGRRSVLRISRMASEMVRLRRSEVRWFVMGEDDTVFMVDNVVRILAKYDHKQYYYIGSSSESHVQNMRFSYGMAFGGGGFAISYALAVELEKMQDKCMQRYPGLYGSDERIQACMAEIGVPLTREPGFHEYDVHGSLFGLLGAHPVTPLASLHHLDVVEPIFPGMTQAKAIQRLFQSVRLDSASIMQQSICYDQRRGWSISLSWGYVVQIIRGVVSPRELEMPARTFLNWYKTADYTGYAFNTRPEARHPCQKPFVYYVSSARYDRAKKVTVSIYSRRRGRYPACEWKMESPERVDTIVVFKKQDPLRWHKSPRRDCCRILPSKRETTLYMSVGQCRDSETLM